MFHSGSFSENSAGLAHSHQYRKLLAQPRVWMGLFGFSAAQAAIPFAGVAWGALLGTAFDPPFVILFPVYLSQNEDIDFIKRHLSVQYAEEQEAREAAEEAAAEALLAEMQGSGDDDE